MVGALGYYIILAGPRPVLAGYGEAPGDETLYGLGKMNRETKSSLAARAQTMVTCDNGRRHTNVH